MRITDFLLARISEKKSQATQDPRALAECKALRQIVQTHAVSDHGLVRPEHDPLTCSECKQSQWPCRTLRALAAVWSDHPDYEPNWEQA